VLSLALGIVANTAVYGVAGAILDDPLSIPRYRSAGG